MTKVSTILHIRNGEITNKQAVRKLFDALQDGRYKATIEKSNKRSLNQNNWFHAVLPDILQGLRNVGFNEVRTTDDVKSILKEMFFKKPVTNGVETFMITEGTSETSKEVFIERADQIITWAKDYLGIDVAPPFKQIEIFS